MDWFLYEGTSITKELRVSIFYVKLLDFFPDFYILSRLASVMNFKKYIKRNHVLVSRRPSTSKA